MLNEQYVIVSHDQLNLHTTRSLVQTPKANVIITHGLGEHSGRYSYVVEKLNRSNLNAYTYDLRGHGKSDGHSAYVNDYRDYLADLHVMIEHVKEENSKVPTFLLGHSMGGFIASLFGIETNDLVSGVVLTGASTQTPRQANPIMRRILQIAGKTAPRVSIKNDLGKIVSKDLDVVQNYLNDPLNKEKITMGLYDQFIIKGIDYVKNNIDQFNYPVLLLHGSDDKIVAPTASLIFHQYASSKDKTLKIYDGLYHEILNEPERDEVIDDITKWILDRCSTL